MNDVGSTTSQRESANDSDIASSVGTAGGVDDAEVARDSGEAEEVATSGRDEASDTAVVGDSGVVDESAPGVDSSTNEAAPPEEISELDAVTSERDQYLDDLRRVSAEFANFRRQTERRNAEVAAQSGARIAESLLVVFDACEAASRQGIDGVEPIAAQLRTVLASEGLEAIHDDGEPFDPTRHEATLSEPADDTNTGPVVVETLRTGYAWNGRVLRAAMVKVKN